MFSTVIDEIDRAIIRHLQRDGRATQRELGRAVGLSPNAAGARLARLVEHGVITGFTARVDHAALGRPLEVSIDIWLEHRPSDVDFLEVVADDERIIDAISITGPVDFRLRAQVASPDDLEALLMRLRNQGRVRQTDSRIVMSHAATAPAVAEAVGSVGARQS